MITFNLRDYSNYLLTTDNNQLERSRASTTMQRNNTVPTEQNELQNKKLRRERAENTKLVSCRPAITAIIQKRGSD